MAVNGRLALSALVVVDSSHRMHFAAAASFLAMRTALFLATGVWLGITEAYRSFEEQDRIFRARYTPGHKSGVWYAGTYWRKRAGVAVAAVPGTSNHGWGIALDIKNYGSTSGPGFRWLLDHAGAFGWSWATGRNVNEPWHWEYIGSLTRPAGGDIVPLLVPELPEEEEMKIAQAHYTRPDGQIVRILYVPGTAWYIEWVEPTPVIANGFGKQFETGDTQITPFVAAQIRDAANRCAK